MRHTLAVDGMSRWYLLTTPTPSVPPVPKPLVLDFHGLAEGANLHATTSQFGPLAQHDGFVVAFPNGTGSPVRWDTSAGAHPNPDIDFVRAMLSDIESSQCIDTTRVYADGFSDGAFMVSLLACTMSNRFAAIAAVSGLQLPQPCHPVRPVPILAFHGTADPILFFNGGVGTATLNRLLGQGGSSKPPPPLPAAHLDGTGYPATVQAWAIKDGCGSHAVDTRIAPHVIHRTYRCPPGVGVSFFIILGGGHAWPGSAISRSLQAFTGHATFEINATDAIWSFFRQYRLG